MKKTALITDLDNTLFDWVELWLNCFSSMLDSIVEISGIEKAKLLPEIAAVLGSICVSIRPSLKRC